MVSAFLQLSGLVFGESGPPLVGDVLRHAAQVTVAVLGEDRAIEHLEKSHLKSHNGAHRYVDFFGKHYQPSPKLCTIVIFQLYLT